MIKEYKCKICNKEYKSITGLSSHITKSHKTSSKEYYDKYIKIDSGNCPTCNKKTKFISMGKGYQKFCSIKCSNRDLKKINQSKQTNIDRYDGVGFSSKIIYNKYQDTLKKKYGVTHNSKLDSFKENITEIYKNKTLEEKEYTNNKRKNTCLNKYNKSSYSKTSEFKEKIKTTHSELYGGVGNSSKILKEKYLFTRRSNNWKNYIRLLSDKNVKPLFNIDYYCDINNKIFKFQCLKCDKNFESNKTNTQNIYCKKCNRQISNKEFELQEWLKKMIEVETNKRFYKNKKYGIELDIFIPEFNLGIEFNGLYWHSEKQKKKNYHIDKTNYFKDNHNIQVIHIFEDEWDNKKEIVKSIILNKLGLNKNIIEVEKTEIKELSNKEYKDFLNENHIKGYKQSKIKVGLYYNDELLSCLGISKNKIIRSCNKLNTSIIGGFSKLIKYIMKIYNTREINIDVDLRYFTGKSFKDIRFKEISTSEPNYYYTKGVLREDKNIKKIDNHYKIFDCGEIKLKYK